MSAEGEVRDIIGESQRVWEELKELCGQDHPLDAEVIKRETFLVDEKKSDLGFPDCVTGGCMAFHFADDVKTIGKDSDGEVTLLKVEEINGASSEHNGVFSISFKAKFRDQFVSVKAFNFCETEKDRNKCPCRISDDRFMKTIGSENKLQNVIPVLGYIWNHRTRVLWIVEGWGGECLDEGYSFMYSVQAMADSLLCMHSEENVCINCYQMNEDDMSEEERAAIVRPRPPAVLPLTPYNRFNCSTVYWYNGKPSFSQRLLENWSTLYSPFICAKLIPEVADFWCDLKSCYPFPSKLHIDLFAQKCMRQEFWFTHHKKDFDQIKEYFGRGDSNPYITWESFLDSVKFFGYWWLDMRAFFEIWPCLKQNVQKSTVIPDREGCRCYHCRKTSSGLPRIVVQFSPPCITRKGPVDNFVLLFDTISRMFFIDKWYVFGETPSICLSGFVEQFTSEKPPLPLLNYLAEQSDAPTPVYVN